VMKRAIPRAVPVPTPLLPRLGGTFDINMR
jgi:hypothetical protein